MVFGMLSMRYSCMALSPSLVLLACFFLVLNGNILQLIHPYSSSSTHGEFGLWKVSLENLGKSPFFSGEVEVQVFFSLGTFPTLGCVLVRNY
uniref:Uncharacterized protein n=1 Tax=Lutzomyia longipalpis TaxID=7200 RepID=A0A7G3B781_LUTLO